MLTLNWDTETELFFLLTVLILHLKRVETIRWQILLQYKRIIGS